MLEEPPVNTYAILTTRSINLVIPTIRSRCQTFTLRSNIAPLSMIASKYNLTNEQISLIKNVYYSYDELNHDLESESFFELYDLAHSIVNNNGDLQVIKDIHDEFKKMDYKQISALLKFLEHMCHGNQVILKIMENIKVNPIKTLMFNQIMEQFGKE
jgi:DNA polymerase-3 subunit delta'